MAVVILTENKILQHLIVVDNWKTVQFVVPNKIVCIVKRNPELSGNQLRKWSHEFFHLQIKRVAAWTIITTGNHAQQFSIRRTIFGNTNCRISGFLLQNQNIAQRTIGSDISVA